MNKFRLKILFFFSSIFFRISFVPIKCKLILDFLFSFKLIATVHTRKQLNKSKENREKNQRQKQNIGENITKTKTKDTEKNMIFF